jgi:carbamoyltransferase
VRVLGLGGGLHDLAACLLEDGVLVRAVEQERLTRVRHACDHEALTAAYRDGSFRARAVEQARRGSAPEISYCLDGEPIESVDAAAHATRWGSALWRAQSWPLRWTARRFRRIRSHHLAHAASAFLVSPFDEALTLVVDSFGTVRRGRFESTSLWVGRDRELTALRIDYSDRVATDATPRKWPQPGEIRSLGVFYSDVTLFCGFNVLDAGKTMGLAPWGTDRCLADLRSYLSLGPDGDVRIDPRYLLYLRECERRWRDLGDEDLLAARADLAFAAQAVLEDAIVHLVRFGCARTGLRSLCLAGGVALNAVANARILEDTPIERIFVQPAANDAGIAIGAAFLLYHHRSRRERAFVMEHAYLGREYDDLTIDEAIARHGNGARVERPQNVCARAADLLAEGKVIAWFQGGSEFGPRALGNRSILADPRSRSTWDRVNELKHRERFRPLAPSVLAEAQSEYFELDTASPYMVLVGRVRPAKRPQLAAVTHVDGTARLQTVDRRTNPRFHELITAFASRTGVPVLLNTSFNVQGPIVETPAEAVETFLRTKLDALVLGNYVLEHPAPAGEIRA